MRKRRRFGACYQDALGPFISAHNLEGLDPLACENLDDAATQLFEANTEFKKVADTNLADWDVEYTAAAVKESFSFITFVLTAASTLLAANFQKWLIFLTPTASGKPRLQLTMSGYDVSAANKSKAVYCFIENKVHSVSGRKKLWASALNGVNTAYDAAVEAERNVMKQKCLGYCEFIKSIGRWVDDFNSDRRPIEEAELYASYFPATGTGINKQNLKEMLETFGAGEEIKVSVRPAGKSDFGGSEAVYKFKLNYFLHTVEDMNFFYRASADARHLARVLIRDRFTQQPSPDGACGRTLMGMLSTWNKYFSTLGLCDMTWVKRKPWWDRGGAVPARAIVLQDCWSDGVATSRSLGTAIKIYDLLMTHGVSRERMDDAIAIFELLKERGHDMSELFTATETYDMLERKAERHGRELDQDLKSLITDVGYYGLAAAGGLRHVKMTNARRRQNPKAFRGFEVNSAVCDACV